MAGLFLGIEMKTEYQYKFIDAHLSMYRTVSVQDIADGLEISHSTARGIWTHYRAMNKQDSITHMKREGGITVRADFEPMYPDLEIAEFLHACKKVFATQRISEKVIEFRKVRAADSRRYDREKSNGR